MTEAIRLIIWDLDDTFWRGTLTEGGMEFLPSNRDIVIEMARRGIMSSICSKNDFEQVRAILEEHAVWDYFIFPSIAWSSKGPRLSEILESVQLRPETVLLIDDNHLNLQEAKHFVPAIQTARETIIPELLSHPLFQGKDDAALSRLIQYRLLQRKRHDQSSASGSNEEFLRACDIRVEIEHDVGKHLVRVIELVNRTNQLNFTKRRLPEDPDAARSELIEFLRIAHIQAGLIRVFDKYGDYGYCGFYALAQYPQGPRLEHFCFSCRTLGMGVEAFTYQIMGRPALAIRGEVLSNPTEYSFVDWIRISNETEERITHSAGHRVPGFYLRGGCDLSNVNHYAKMIAPEVIGEFNYQRCGIDIRIDHSLIARHIIRGLPPEAIVAFHELGYVAEDFQSELFDRRPTGLWVLSFSPDHWVNVYRHRATGILIPFHPAGFPTDRSATTVPRDQRASFTSNAETLKAVDALERDYDFVGLIGEGDFKDNLRAILDAISRESHVVVLMHREFYGIEDIPEKAAKPTIRVNGWIREAAEHHVNVEAIPMMRFVHSAEDLLLENNHFSRMAYFRLFEHLKGTAMSRAKRVA